MQYSSIQTSQNNHATWARHEKFFIVHAHKHACVCNINDIKFIIESSHLCNGHMHDDLHTQVCMSAMHMPNLDFVH